MSFISSLATQINYRFGHASNFLVVWPLDPTFNQSYWG